MFANTLIDLFHSQRALNASGNLVFRKIALDQCNREQNFTSASESIICGSLAMGPETSLVGLSGDLLEEG